MYEQSQDHLTENNTEVATVFALSFPFPLCRFFVIVLLARDS